MILNEVGPFIFFCWVTSAETNKKKTIWWCSFWYDNNNHNRKQSECNSMQRREWHHKRALLSWWLWFCLYYNMFSTPLFFFCLCLEDSNEAQVALTFQTQIKKNNKQQLNCCDQLISNFFYQWIFSVHLCVANYPLFQESYWNCWISVFFFFLLYASFVPGVCSMHLLCLV